MILNSRYDCPPNAPISESLKRYENAFKGASDFQRYAAPPLPPYLEDTSGLSVDLDSSKEDEGEEAVYDTNYHLLKLFCQKGYPLEHILNPTTVTANSLDYRLRSVSV